MGSSHRDKLISMVVLHISRVAERDAGGGGWMIQKWQFQCDAGSVGVEWVTWGKMGN